MSAGERGAIEIRDLELLLAVVEAGSFRGAARVFTAEPSLVSRRVRALEDRLGTSLFERTRSGVRLTGAGQSFHRDACQIIDSLDKAIRAVSVAGRGAGGSVAIGVVGSLSSSFLGRLIRLFRKEHPAVNLRVCEGAYHDHLAALADRTLDLAFVLGLPKPASFNAHRFWSEPIVAAMRSDDERATRAPLPFTALIRDRLIVSEEPPGPSVHDYIIRTMSSPNFSPEVVVYKVGREGLMSLVGLGFGTSLACDSESRIAYPDVVFVPLIGLSIAFSAVWSAQNDNPALRRLLSLARRLARDEAEVLS